MSRIQERIDKLYKQRDDFISTHDINTMPWYTGELYAGILYAFSKEIHELEILRDLELDLLDV